MYEIMYSFIYIYIYHEVSVVAVGGLFLSHGGSGGNLWTVDSFQG